MARKRSPQERIRLAIRRAGMTRAEFADALGVSVHTVHAWLKPPDNRAYREPRQRDVLAAEVLAGRRAGRRADR